MTEDKIPFLASYSKNIYLWKKSPQNFTNVNLFKNQIDYLKKWKFINYKLWKKAFLECYIQIVQFSTEIQTLQQF